jgi:hypothetical protein
MLRGYILLLLVGAFYLPETQAQEVELGIWGGLTSSFGDINNSKESMQLYQPGAGVFFRYNYNSRIAGYLGINGGVTSGYDSISNDPYQLRRNLSFRTNVFDFTTRLDFNFLPLDRNKHKNWFSPYLFVGFSLYYFNPQAYYDSTWVELQPLGTEGQQFPELTSNDKYHRVQLGIPMGGGVKFALNKNFTIGIESNWHWLFTDYLDDVSKTYVDPSILAAGIQGDLTVTLADRSIATDVIPLSSPGRQRGDSRHNDAYLFTGIFLSYTFVDIKCYKPGKWGTK